MAKSMKTAGHRKSGAFGYKALVTYADGRTYQPLRRNFKTADEARAYAAKWIAANEAPRVVPVSLGGTGVTGR